MAKDGEGSSGPSDGNNLSTPSSSGRQGLRSRPYDANNSFVRKVATKVTDLIPQKSWISRWFDNSQDEARLQNPESEDTFDDKQPPLKRPCIRMDVTHPPGTFSITPRNKNLGSDSGPSKEQQFSNHNDTTRDFLEPSVSGQGIHRFVSSTPAYSAESGKISDNRPTLNMLMSRTEEQNNNGPANGTDDHSESSESTSGCSSLIPQNNRQGLPANTNYNSPFGSKRRYIDEKLSFTNHLQSPRSLFLDNSNRDTLGSRRPSFNSLMMNNSLTRSNSLASPFYNGNTTFGGANAANLYRRSNSVLSEPAQYQVKRTSVEVNPSSESSQADLSGMSHTARRIMQALEQFSSPLSDAKKIPVRNVMGGSSNNSTLNMSPTTSRKRAREDETASPRVGLRHLTRELPVPSVPELLRIRRRQKLQNTTVNARKIMTARSNATASAPQEYHIRTEADVEPKRNTQLKAKKKTKLEEQETVEAVNLPTIPLPISNLPRFDIALPQCTKPSSNPKQSPKPADKGNDSFKFASPIKLSDGAKNLESINNFTFSKPMSPSKITSLNDSQELSKTLSVASTDTLNFSSGAPSFPNFMWTGPTQTLKPKEKVKEKAVEPSGLKVASELKSGSVMDFFTKKSSLPPSSDFSNVWECNECLIKNSESESYCIACKSPRPDTSSDIEILECPSDSQDSKSSQPMQEDSIPTKTNTASLFGKLNSTSSATSNTKSKAEPIVIDLDDDSPPKKASPAAAVPVPAALRFVNAFKPAISLWECPCCMVRNTDSVLICPCCNTAKPGSVNISPKRTKSEQDAASTTSTTSTSATSSWGSQFKKPEGSWSCDTCMIQNKPDVGKCAACETPKPGAAKSTAPAATVSTSSFSGFGDKFKKPEGAWSCDICMVQNKSDVNKCVACETPRPGSAAQPAAQPAAPQGLQFKVSMPANAGSFSFGVDKAGDAAKQATTSLPTANGFSFGSTENQTSSSSGFSFGVPSVDKAKQGADSATKSGGFSFKPSDTPAATATFQFGSKPAESKDKEEAKKPTATPSFSFGAPSKTDEKSASTGFIFGAPAPAKPVVENKPEEKKESAKALSGGFVFGASAASTTDSSVGLGAGTQPKLCFEESKPVSSTPTLAGSFLFGSPKPATDAQSKENQTKPATTPVPTFGASVEQKPAAPTFSFGAPAAAQSTTTTPAANSPALFTFTGQQKSGDSTTQNTTSLPAFGSAAAPKPAFSFGKPAETTPTNVQPTENKPALTFGAAAATPTFGSQTNQATPSLFGNAGVTPAQATNLGESKPLLFGAPENKIAPPAFGASTENKPTFGSPLAAKPAASAFPSSAGNAASPFGASSPSVFGSNPAPAFGANAATSSIFGASKPAEATQAPTRELFSQVQPVQPVAPAFNFSSENVQQPSGLFTFGGSNTGPVGNGFGGGGGFGAASPAVPAATPNFTFNAPPKQEAPASIGFGKPSTPAATPMLNATPVQPASGGFNFGNASVPNSFSFGSQAPAPATGGFNFNAPNNPPGAPPITFNPNVTPTFNFTAGSGAPTTFNATPQRIIKKAVRRIQRP